MQISIELSEDQSRQLAELAARLSVDPRELARAAISGLLTHPDDDFVRAASYVLEKNRELYERLS